MIRTIDYCVLMQIFSRVTPRDVIALLLTSRDNSLLLKDDEFIDRLEELFMVPKQNRMCRIVRETSTCDNAQRIDNFIKEGDTSTLIRFLISRNLKISGFALRKLVKRNNEDLILDLLNHDLIINISSVNSDVVRMDWVKIMNFILIRSGSSIESFIDGAILNGSVKVLWLLIERGADINCILRMICAKNSKIFPSICKKCLVAGLDINYQDLLSYVPINTKGVFLDIFWDKLREHNFLKYVIISHDINNYDDESQYVRMVERLVNHLEYNALKHTFKGIYRSGNRDMLQLFANKDRKIDIALKIVNGDIAAVRCTPPRYFTRQCLKIAVAEPSCEVLKLTIKKLRKAAIAPSPETLVNLVAKARLHGDVGLLLLIARMCERLSISVKSIVLKALLEALTCTEGDVIRAITVNITVVDHDPSIIPTTLLERGPPRELFIFACEYRGECEEVEELSYNEENAPRRVVLENTISFLCGYFSRKFIKSRLIIALKNDDFVVSNILFNFLNK